VTTRELAFKANAGIKDIIGRGLILDDNIAVIELIKNSKDAESSKVKISFSQNEDLLSEAKLVLTDFGHGMDIDDIKDKWLNIAYSEKRHQKKKGNKAYAGNKGVGRFSCDRLGKKLILYTKSAKGEYIKLPIDWTKFEVNLKEAEISSVRLKYEVLSKDDFLEEIGEPDFKTGTVLKITDLRSSWSDKKLKKLVSELEKFVSAPDSEFKIFLTINDAKEKQIKNNVFDELEFRTYYIKSSIDSSGNKIKTALYYHGEAIYEYTALNPYEHLKNVSLTVHYLNFTAKTYFKRRTGYSTNDYGSVFLFLNDFRVSPYGNPKNDWLGLDQRKSQGTSRYFGTREVLGKITLEDHEDTFAPVTSREGMVHNEAFLELTAHDKDHKTKLKNGNLDYGYVPHIIRQLERVVVQGLNWHSLIDLENPDKTNINESDLKRDPTRYALKSVDPKLLEELIEKLLKSSSFQVEKFKINKPLIKRLSKESEDAYNEFILSFIKNTTGKKFEDLSPKYKGDFRKIAEDNMRALKAQKVAEIKAAEEKRRADEAETRAAEEKARADEAEKKTKEAEAKAKESDAKAKEAGAKAKAAEKTVAEVQKKLKTVRSENAFLRSDSNKDSDLLMNLHHQIVLYCSTAESEIENLKNILLGKETVPTEEVLDFLLSIEGDITKISKVSGFATNQKYKLALDSVEGSLVQFISDYIDELNDNKLLSRRMKLTNKLDKQVVFETAFSPMDIMILVDNFIANTRRTKTKELIFSSPVSEDGLFVVSDKGPGLDVSIKDPSKIFEKGFTTTEGSGRGLYHVRETLKELGLSIRVIEDKKLFKGLALEVFINAD
jgi:signal transduction histidine kinase